MKKTRVPEELQDLAVWQAAIYAGGTAMDLLAADRAGWEVTPYINLEEQFTDAYYSVVDRAAAVLGISHEELQARLDSERDPLLVPLVDAALHRWLSDKEVKRGGKQQQELEKYLARLEARRAEQENPFEQPEPPDELYDPEELDKGIEEEYEHTTDRRIAKRIAKDHLDMDPLYYRKLKILGLNPKDFDLFRFRFRFRGGI